MKIGISTDSDDFAEYYEATVVSAVDYYPFGSAMAGRKYNQGTYRFGFNGKEEDSEWGSQMIQDYGFRIYNPTIGKFLSVDPLTNSYPWYTPYQFAGNKVIQAIDLDGLEEEFKFDVYEKMKDPAYGRKRIKTYKGTEVDVYQMAFTNVFSNVGNPNFEYSEYANVKNAELKIIKFFNEPLNPAVPKSKVSKEVIEVEHVIKENVSNALFSEDSKNQQAAVKQIKARSNFWYNTPIASFADMFIPVNAGIKAVEAGKAIHISLGISKSGDDAILKTFAGKMKAPHMEDWEKLGLYSPDVKSFEEAFEEVTKIVKETNGTIHFNLQKFDFARAVKQKGLDLFDANQSYTGWEFWQIMDNPELLKRTKFYEGGAEISSEQVLKRIEGAKKASKQKGN